MSETIIIPNVNVELLEQQRLALVRVTFAMDVVQPHGVEPEDVELLTGLLNMLDYWSNEYHASDNSPKPPANRNEKQRRKAR